VSNDWVYVVDCVMWLMRQDVSVLASERYTRWRNKHSTPQLYSD